MGDEATKLERVCNSQPVHWPRWARELSPEAVDEIIHRVYRTAILVINAAGEEVLITDAEIRKATSLYYKRELIEAKITAWEWFFRPWLGLQPRLSLEEVCRVLHAQPQWVRECVERQPASKRTRFRMQPGYRIAELWDDVCGRCEGLCHLDEDGKPSRSTGRACPSCGGLGTKREDRIRHKVAEIQAEADAAAAAAAAGTPTAASASFPDESKRLVAAAAEPSILLPPPPERLRQAQALLVAFQRGPAAPSSPADEERARVLRIGFDLLGDAAAGIALATK